MAQVYSGSMPDQGAGGGARVERLLARYPALSEDELAELLHWFEREASALDVALVASNRQIGRGYDLFKAEHIDRFRFRDVIHAVVFLAAFGTAMLGVVWLAG